MHASTLLIIATSALGAFAAPAAAPAPCKNADTFEYAGVKFNTCGATAFEGVTVKEIPGVKNLKECAKLCATTAGCSRVVWDTKQKWCLFKGSDSTGPLVKSNIYQTAEVYDQVADGAVSPTCYGAENFITVKKVPKLSDGTPYIPCLNADSVGDSADIIGGVTSAKDCAAICAARPGGFNGVWVSEFNACHVKPEDSNEPIVFRRGFTRVLVANVPSTPPS